MPAGGLLIGSIGAPILGGIVGNLMSSGDRDKAQGYNQKALEAITGLSLPSIEEQKIALEQLQSQGKLTPEMLQTLTQSDSELSGISTDPRLKEAQMNALSSLSKQGEEGLTANDRVALNTVRRENDQNVQGKNAAILQNMAQRGMGGSGSELASQLINSQEGADRASQESDRLAAMAQQNALQATAQSGQLGGQIRSQDYNEKSAAAQAQDAINRFNTTNSQGVAQYNVGNRNDAQKTNLASDQRIADANTATRNNQAVYNKELIGKNYQNQVQKAGLLSNAYNNAAGAANNTADKTAAMYTGIGQGVGQAAGAGAGYMMQPQKKAHGGMIESDLPLLKYMSGGQVDGQAKHPGDDERNDTVPAVLSPGEIVIPRSIASSSDEAILDFVRHVKKASKRH